MGTPLPRATATRRTGLIQGSSGITTTATSHRVATSASGCRRFGTTIIAWTSRPQNVYAGLSGFYLLFDALDEHGEDIGVENADPNRFPSNWRLPSGKI